MIYDSTPNILYNVNCDYDMDLSYIAGNQTLSFERLSTDSIVYYIEAAIEYGTACARLADSTSCFILLKQNDLNFI